MLEYRGYGRSDGTPGEEGMYMDAQVYYSLYDQREPLVRRGCIWVHRYTIVYIIRWNP
jgi:hypothetical protein